MSPNKYLPVIAIASLLGACANQPSDLNVSEVRGLPQKGDEFQRALHQEYVSLAQIEIDEAHRGATTYFNTKARRAAANGTVLPTPMDQRSIPDANVRELTEARAELMRVLNAGGAARAPLPTARAQAQFDCWLEEQEENAQPKDIALCRGGYMSAMNDASKIVFAEAKPMGQPKSVDGMSELSSYTIYFNHNSSDLGEQATLLKDEIAARIKETRATGVTVNGYTDRSGTRGYNTELAERRAATVSEAIEAIGIKPVIRFKSFGEDHLAVQTADDVREWKNRRVVVTLTK